MLPDYYYTIERSASAEFKDRGSKFIAYAFPVAGVVDFKKQLQALKEEHPKAAHHCFAYRIGTDGNTFRSNDDGEPSGSAGKPILGQIDSKQLTDLAVVVVRYFGGTLLGVPGLINAYKTTAELALNEAKVIEKTVNDVYTIAFDYLQMNDVMRLIKEDNLQVLNQQFDNSCEIRVSIRKMQVNQALDKLQKLNSVKVKFDYTI